MHERPRVVIYLDRCEHCDLYDVPPVEIYPDPGGYDALYRCPSGHVWVTAWENEAATQEGA